MPILSIYASLLAVIFVVLSVRTLRLRRHLKIAIGDAGNEHMLRAMRVHSNFAEYTPYALLMIYFVETSGASPVLVHALGLFLLIGRLAHAFGVSQYNEQYHYRVAGMTLTFSVFFLSSAYLLTLAAQGAI